MKMLEKEKLKEENNKIISELNEKIKQNNEQLENEKNKNIEMEKQNTQNKETIKSLEEEIILIIKRKILMI